MLRNYVIGEKVEEKFTPLPTGTYKATLVGMMEKNSQYQGDYVEAEWKINYPEEHSHRSLWEKFYLGSDDPEILDKAERKYNQFCQEMGGSLNGTLDWDTILMQERVLKVFSGEYKSKPYTKVNDRLPISSYDEEVAKDAAKPQKKNKTPVPSTGGAYAELNDEISF